MMTVHPSPSSSHHAVALAGEHHREQERGVAEVLLRVSPNRDPSAPSQNLPDSASVSAGIRPDTYAGLESLAEQASSHLKPSFRPPPINNSPEADRSTGTTTSTPPPLGKVITGGGGLDALAALASEARSTTATRSSNSLHAAPKSGIITSNSPASSDEEEMPPPPPRNGPARRQRSASNPEGMEKWDSLNTGSRRHFVLPASILEEELAEASAAIQQRKMRERASSLPDVAEETEHLEESPEDGESNASPDSVMAVDAGEESGKREKQSTASASNQRSKDDDEEEAEEEVDESKLSPEDLLKRARSRLLEDLSEGNMNGEKGVLTLPHSLSKYKEVYNKNGRIGIYTPAERAAIIARFNKKRQRRVWNKKIRYNCRKSLADRRLRVKGRFVKRSEQEQLAKEIQARAEEEQQQQQQQKVVTIVEPQTGGKQQRRGGKANNDGGGENSAGSASNDDVDMPDVNDPEAGFAPTEDQPFRRLRRHTIT